MVTYVLPWTGRVRRAPCTTCGIHRATHASDVQFIMLLGIKHMIQARPAGCICHLCSILLTLATSGVFGINGATSFRFFHPSLSFFFHLPSYSFFLSIPSAFCAANLRLASLQQRVYFQAQIDFSDNFNFF